MTDTEKIDARATEAVRRELDRKRESSPKSTTDDLPVLSKRGMFIPGWAVVGFITVVLGAGGAIVESRLKTAGNAEHIAKIEAARQVEVLEARSLQERQASTIARVDKIETKAETLKTKVEDMNGNIIAICSKLNAGCKR